MGDVNDPFYLVKDDIQDSVNKVKEIGERMERLPEGNSERGKYAGQIASECASVLWQLEELDRATAMAEQDFMRFKVDANELASRKRWTAATKATVSDLDAKAKAVIDARKARGGGYSGEGSRLDGAIGQQNDGYLNSQGDQQQLLMQRQDVDLDDISASINRIGQVGLTIGEELETQGKMLDDLEQDVEGTNSRLQAAQRKMNQVLKKAGTKGQLAIIAVLTALLIILFLIAFM
jgi:SYP6 family syntaxin